MAGDTHGAEETDARNGPEPQTQGREAGDTASGSQQVVGDDFEAQLAAKGKRMAKLSAQVAKAAKAVEATVALSGQIETLKQQIANEWVEFALKAAGAHDVRAARALRDDYEETEGERTAAMAEACPWLFEDRKSSPVPLLRLLLIHLAEQRGLNPPGRRAQPLALGEHREAHGKEGLLP